MQPNRAVCADQKKKSQSAPGESILHWQTTQTWIKDIIKSWEAKWHDVTCLLGCQPAGRQAICFSQLHRIFSKMLSREQYVCWGEMKTWRRSKSVASLVKVLFLPEGEREVLRIPIHWKASFNLVSYCMLARSQRRASCKCCRGIGRMLIKMISCLKGSLVAQQ